MRRSRISDRLARDEYALSPITASGLVLGLPPLSRGTRTASMTTGNMGESPPWPGPRITARGWPLPSPILLSPACQIDGGWPGSWSVRPSSGWSRRRSATTLEDRLTGHANTGFSSQNLIYAAAPGVISFRSAVTVLNQTVTITLCGPTSTLPGASGRRAGCRSRPSSTSARCLAGPGQRDFL
jgi:hypothetical protein